MSKFRTLNSSHLDQMEQEHKELIGTCPVCGQPRVVKISRTTKNPNRAFVACANRDHKSFAWLDELKAQSSFLSKPKPSLEHFAKPSSLPGASFLSVNPINQTENEKREDVPGREDRLSFLDVPAFTPSDKKLVWSDYQEAIFDFVEHDTGNAVVIARAGAAKTTTGIECLNRVPKDAETAFVAFGVDIVETLKERAPSDAYIKTTHAMCLENARNEFGKELKVNEFKLADIWELLDPSGDAYELKPSAIKMVNALKATLREPTQDNMEWLADRYDIEVNGDAVRLFELSEKLYRYSLQDTEQLDFEDMLYLTATGKVPAQQFDFIFGDEFQDMTYAQTRAIKNSLKPDGRIVVLADPMQSIFGFRFSDVDSVDHSITEYQAKTFSLPISYRCSRAVIRKAQEIVPDIQARPDAPEGKVIETETLPYLRAGDTVLCRMNRFLVEPCFKLIRAGTKATILGRDIGNNLVSLLQRGEKKAATRQTRQVIFALESYISNECSRLERQRKLSQAESLKDRYETLKILSEGCQETGDVRKRINAIFSKDKKDIVFSTGHKFKGNESERVFIIEHRLLSPQRFDNAQWQLDQLTNLKYVCYTRAKEELYLVN